MQTGYALNGAAGIPTILAPQKVPLTDLKTMYFPLKAKNAPEAQEPESWEPAQVLDRWNSWVLVHFPHQDLTTWMDLSKEPYQPLSSSEAAWRLDELNRAN